MGWPRAVENIYHKGLAETSHSHLCCDFESQAATMVLLRSIDHPFPSLRGLI
jgi:hypothetical protein